MSKKKEVMQNLEVFLIENKTPYINLYWSIKIDREQFSPQLLKFCNDNCISFTFWENDSEYILYKV